MSTKNHVFELQGNWTGDLTGHGSVATTSLTQTVSAPASLGGSGRGTNPEELLLAAAASCYLITLAAVLRYRAFEVDSILLSSEASYRFEERKLSLVSITHTPVVRLKTDPSEEQNAALKAALLAAEAGCMVAQALKVETYIKTDSLG